MQCTYALQVYLTNNGRVLAAVTSLLEAWLVARRWWRERRGEGEEVEEVHCFAPVRLPASHRLLWVLANINSSISFLIRQLSNITTCWSYFANLFFSSKSDYH